MNLYVYSLSIHTQNVSLTLYPQTAGLNDIVPDNLLSIFDDNELEVSV